jgi:tetratricopeptide (TPR) repeat protein
MGRKQPRARKYIYFCITSLIFLSLFNCATIKDIREQSEAREYLLRGHELLSQKDYEGALSEYQKALSMSTRKPQEAEALFNIGLIYAHFGYPKKDYGKSQNVFIKILNDYPESPFVEQSRIWVGVLQEHKRISQMIEKSKQTIKELEKSKQTFKEPEKPKKLKTKTEEFGVTQEYLLQGQRLLAQGDYEGSINENQKILSMSTHQPPRDEALFNLGLIYAHFGNPKKDFGKSLDFFKKLIKDYPRSPLVEQAKIWVEVLQENEELNHVIQKLKQVDIEIEERKREQAK